jgi:general secretion pathway protein E
LRRGGCLRTARRASRRRLYLDVRVAIMPTQHGETAVIRFLPRDRGLLDIAKLGLRVHDERKLRRFLDLPHGMIIITGPTGSGKTTTLATMLSALNTPSRKILTVEDPVEYEIAGINQSQVKPAIGLTFASALRAFVRQDPDVIMVGDRGSPPPSRSRRRGIPAEIDAPGRHWAAVGPRPL